MQVKVLGIKIDDISLSEALVKVEKWLHEGGKHYIVTPNPEIVVAAQKDVRLRGILNNADLAIPDGVGLKLSGKIKNTVAGVDLMEELIRLSSEKGFKIGFLGGREGVAERLVECLKRQYQTISVAFAGSGGKVSKEGEIEAEKDIKFPPIDILFVAFGHPKQEKWISRNLQKVPVNVMMGVGGSLDELAGVVPKCPVWIQRLGFKWLFRLILEPWRIKRQLALIKYIWLLQQSK